jgi:hypothetical protein
MKKKPKGRKNGLRKLPKMFLFVSCLDFFMFFFGEEGVFD